MRPVFKQMFLAGLLATTGFAAFAQMPGGPQGPGPGAMAHERMGGPMMGNRMGPQHDPAAMQDRLRERHVAHMAVLKDRLKIAPAQESAWAAFSAAMQPAADRVAQRQQIRAEMEKLSTPERIDRMRTLRAQRDAEMVKRGDAAKTFYAALTPEQKKTFDAESLRHHRHGGPGGPGGRGGPHMHMHG